jgi:hypothetical protein
MSLTDIVQTAGEITLSLGGLGVFAYGVYRLAKDHIIPYTKKVEEEIGPEVDKDDYKF